MGGLGELMGGVGSPDRGLGGGGGGKGYRREGGCGGVYRMFHV